MIFTKSSKLVTGSIPMRKNKNELAQKSHESHEEEGELRPEFIAKIKRREKQKPVKYDF